MSAFHDTTRLVGTCRVFRQHVRLEVGSGKMALSRPTHQRVTPAVGRLTCTINNMRYFLRLLIFVILSLTLSSCGVGSAIYNIYRSQENIPAPDHVLEANGDYEALWSRADIHAEGANSLGTTPMIVSSPNKIIIMGWRKDSFRDSIILGLNAESGEILWEVPAWYSGKIIASDNAVYLGTSGTAKVRSLNVENGELLWSTPLPWAHSVVDIYFAENQIFAHTNDSEFFVLNEQGKILDNYPETFRTFLELNRVLYMDDVPGIKAVELATKNELWSLDIDDRYTYAPIFDDGEIFLRTWANPGKIYSIDQYIGKVNWVTSQDALSNLCLLGETIYFTSFDGSLVAINRYTGDEISRVKFSPQFDLDKQISDYYVACDPTSNVLVISFGDNNQIMGLKVINP
jgi:outer membrane protein assembly factor BamB